jgi:hypothetical protein
MAPLLQGLPVELVFITSLLVQPQPGFMGRAVTVTKPKLDATGFFPKGPASVCLQGSPRQCYTAPTDFGRDPDATVIQIDKETSAIFFSAASGGVSGLTIHFALLRPGTGKELEDLFMSDPSVSNQSEHAWWTDLTISDAKIFVTADFVWGPGEAHYDEHRYVISAYVRKRELMLDGANYYFLDDRYMTARRYEGEKANVLGSEKQEILARLKRAKVQSAR